MTRVRLVAEQGLPHALAEKAVDEVETALATAVGRSYQITIEVGALMLAEDGQVHLSGSVPRDMNDDDVVIFLTELPRLRNGRPVPAEIDRDRGAAIVSVPACGAVGLKRRVTGLLVECVAQLIDSGGRDDRSAAATPVYIGTRNVRWFADTDRSGQRYLIALWWWGRARVVAGMVRINRPWRLVSTLKGVIAAAAATASFGIFYTSIWQMAAMLSVWRLVLIAAFSIMIMVLWLIVSNRLWEQARDRGYGRAWARLYNVTTVATVGIGTIAMYAGLYVLTLIAGVVVIDVGFMEQEISGPASVGNFLRLAWLSTSMGIVAGALGSSVDSYDAILRATFGQRERERRERLEEERAAADADED